MSSAPPSAIVARIRALRELARKNDNPNEAAAAAAAAEKLLAEHQIEEAAIESLSDVPAEAVTEEPLDAMGSRIIYWQAYLLRTLCTMHGCTHCYDRRREGRKTTIRPLVYGRPEDIAIVRDLFAWLSGEIERLADVQGAGRGAAWRQSYLVGCQYGIGEAMKLAARRAREGAPSTALARLDARLTQAKAFEKKQNPAKKQVTREEKLHAEAFDVGREAGQRLHGAATARSSASPKTLK